MLNLNRKIITVSNIPVRNVRDNVSHCKCNLNTEYTLIGEILINESWHQTKWTKKGDNISGISSWNITNV